LSIGCALTLVAANSLGAGPPTFASLAKLPDWSGTWAMPDRAFMGVMRAGASAPFRPEYAARARARSNSTACLPTGMPGIMALPLGYEFLFTPGRVTILTEEGPMIRRIYTDGRGHSEDPEPSFTGESIGHWEGSTLIVDTIAIKPATEFINRLKTSGKTHVIERFSLKDPDHMLVETEIDDPVALSQAWRYSVTYLRSKTAFVESYYCENDRDSRGEPDLQAPAAPESRR
jgi:hypothetical protein